MIEAYQHGIFPWSGEDPIPWCAPDPRLVLRPDAFHASHSLRKLARRGTYHVTFDTDFRSVIRACAQTSRRDQHGTWITPNMIQCYESLHRRFIAHSVEVRLGDDLVAGVYGLTFGRAFFGESMFHRRNDTSKLALMALCDRLRARAFHFIDCQAVTPHLVSLGATAIPLERYLEMLGDALRFPSLHESWRDW